MGIASDFFDKNDLHLHIPAGASPKDGPSAGVTMAAALVSLIAGRKVKPHLGMTGEITLRGQVLPIGGVKEKVLAAHRNGLKTVVLPERNKHDLEDVPDEVKNSMKFVFVQTVEDVLEAGLEPAPAKRKSKSALGAQEASDREEQGQWQGSSSPKMMPPWSACSARC